MSFEREGKEGAETIGNPRHDREGFMRFRIHPATVPPMPPNWWNTESVGLRREAEHRRQGFSPDQRCLWRVISGTQLGTKCLRGVVISGHVVDFFVPEARLIIDTAPAPRFLGRSLAWLTITPERLAHDFDGAHRDIQAQVTERAGVVAYDPAKVYDIPQLPPFESDRMHAMIASAITKTHLRPAKAA